MTGLPVNQCLEHRELLLQFAECLPPLNSCPPIPILFASSFAQVQILEVRVLAGELVVDVFALGCRADPDVDGSDTTRLADGVDELKETGVFGCQVRTGHRVLSISKSTDRIIGALKFCRSITLSTEPTSDCV